MSADERLGFNGCKRKHSENAPATNPYGTVLHTLSFTRVHDTSHESSSNNKQTQSQNSYTPEYNTILQVLMRMPHGFVHTHRLSRSAHHDPCHHRRAHTLIMLGYTNGVAWAGAADWPPDKRLLSEKKDERRRALSCGRVGPPAARAAPRNATSEACRLRVGNCGRYA